MNRSSTLLQGLGGKPVITNSEMSVYRGNLTVKTLLEQTKRVKDIFPKLPQGWHDEFQQAIKDHKFTDQRLIDAVNHVRDTCEYQEPTIARFIQYDRKIEMLTQFEMMEKQKSFGETVWQLYTKVDIDGRLYFTQNENVLKYHLKPWIPKREEPKIIIRKDPDPKKWDGMFRQVLQELDEQIGERKQ